MIEGVKTHSQSHFCIGNINQVKGYIITMVKRTINGLVGFAMLGALSKVDASYSASKLIN